MDSVQGSFFALKDGATDNLVAVMENKELLWLIGEKTTEIWYDAGGAPGAVGATFAFQRIVGTLMQAGCKAKHSVSRFGTPGQDGLIWFGRSERGENVVILTQGFQDTEVSTPAFGDDIAKYPSPRRHWLHLPGRYPRVLCADVPDCGRDVGL